MLSRKVKSFDCYGYGWLFDNSSGEVLDNSNIDLSKFSLGKGYTVSIQHFGVLDPLFGDYDSDNPWMTDIDFISYVLKTTNKLNAFLKSEAIEEIIEDLEIQDPRSNVYDILDVAIDRDPDRYIKDVFQDLGIANDYAICGITDENYITELLTKMNYLNNPEVQVEFLG